MGIRSSVTLNIEFTDAPVELVGVQRLGLIKYVMALMNASRLAVAAQSVGIMSEAYDCAKRRLVRNQREK